MNYSQIVEQKISTSPQGSTAVFVALNEKWGLKLFQCPQNRDRIFKMQKKFQKFGAAPKAWKRVDLPTGNFRHGYLTEIVETIVPNELFLLYKKDPAKYWQETEKLHDKFSEDLLMERVDELCNLTGVLLNDMHLENWGIKNWQLIPIDFGAYTDEKGRTFFNDGEIWG